MIRFDQMWPEQAGDFGTSENTLGDDEFDRIENNQEEPTGTGSRRAFTDYIKTETDAGVKTSNQLFGEYSKDLTPLFQRGETIGENPLHNYASYVYNISMHVLTKEDWKEIVQTPRSWAPKANVIGGAGGFLEIRRKEFYEDFFIDNLEMDQTVAPAAGTRTTNAFHLKFTIIEPNGMTLLDRILAMAKSGDFGANVNWTRLPYVLQIDFTGYLDSGEIVPLTEQTKYIPIYIINMQIKPSMKGTEYYCEAVPFTHQAYSQEIGTSPVGVELTGGTLSQFFESEAGADVEAEFSGRSAIAKAAQGAVNAIKSRNQQPTETQTKTLGQAMDMLGGEGDSAYKVRSFVAAYNTWNKGKFDNNDVDGYDEIYVQFADEILAKEKLVDPKTTPTNQTPNTDRDDKKVAGKQATGTDPAGPKKDKSKYAFNKGTHVTEIINIAMQNSEFWRSQFSDFNPEEEKDGPKNDVIRGWKIIPKLELKDWDPKRGRYNFKVTYFVKVHVKYNREITNAPQAFPSAFARQYNYQFTGENRDVITWDFKFDALYTTNIVSDARKNSAVAGQAEKPVDPEANAQSATANDREQTIEYDQNGNPVGVGGPGGGLNPVQKKVTTDTPAATGSNANKDAISMIAANIYDNMYYKSAEMAETKLRIVGDPCFIMQEEIFHAPDSDLGELNTPSSEYVNGGLTLNDGAGTIKMNSGEVHVRLRWKSPMDFDESTGLFGSAGFQQVALNGLYKIYHMKSHFQNGKFEQEIDCVRLFQQPDEIAKDAQNMMEWLREVPPPVKQFASASGDIPGPADRFNFKENFPSPVQRLSTSDTEDTSAPFRDESQTFPTTSLKNFATDGFTGFAEKYNIPTGFPNPPVDKFNLPTGVNVDEATGLPVYKSNLFTGGQKDIAAWKQAVDEKQTFSWTVTRNSGNTGIDTFTA